MSLLVNRPINRHVISFFHSPVLLYAVLAFHSIVLIDAIYNFFRMVRGRCGRAVRPMRGLCRPVVDMQT